MFTKMLHFRWVSFLGIQRVCEYQRLVETEQLKAYSRVFRNTCTLYLFLNDGKILHSSKRVSKVYRNQSYFGWLGFVFTPRTVVQGMLQVHFYIENAPRSHGLQNRILLVFKIILQATNCPYKSTPLFLKKIHFKKLRKTMKKKYKKKKSKSKPSSKTSKLI